jgi:anti-sigma factor RsiW
MNLDDDTLLSAYLDGQLDQEERHMVESALVSNPGLAEKLRSLTTLRDLLGSLNRDFSIDVTTRVIERMRLTRGVKWRTLPRLASWRGAHFSRRPALVAGIAAGFLLCVALAAPLLVKYAYRPGHVGALATEGSMSLPAPRDGVIRADSGEAPGALRAADSGAMVYVAAQGGGTSSVGLAARGDLPGDSHRIQESNKTHALEHYRQLLDNPNQRRLFRITDGGDGKALQQVASVVESTTRFGFYKITISQGIVIDPHHPEEATVFAALANATDLDSLRDRLSRAFDDRVDESSADPAILTQLADASHVRAFGSDPFGDVLIPHEGLALQRDDEADADFETTGNKVQPTPLATTTIEQERSAPIGDEIAKRRAAQAGMDRAPALPRQSAGVARVQARSGDGAIDNSKARGPGTRTQIGPAARARRRDTSEDNFVVLVWVARSHRG